MTTQFDTTFRKLAKDLINTTFGTPATLTRETSTYDVNTGTNNKTASDNSVKISPPAPVNQKRTGDGPIQTDDFTCLLAAATAPFAPNPVTDKMTWRGNEYQIVQVNPIVSGDQDAAYELILRR